MSQLSGALSAGQAQLPYSRLRRSSGPHFTAVPSEALPLRPLHFTVSRRSSGQSKRSAMGWPNASIGIGVAWAGLSSCCSDTLPPACSSEGMNIWMLRLKLRRFDVAIALSRLWVSMPE